jgi:xanthine dehydrogenase accessory factor
MRDVVNDVERWLAEGKRIALATVVARKGSAPRGVGATLAVTEGMEVSGSVSGGCVEPAVIEEGLRAIKTGKPKLLKFGISEEQNVERIGLACGGEIEVFVEPLGDVQASLHALHNDIPLVRAVVVAAPDPSVVGKTCVMTAAEDEARCDIADEALKAGVLTRARELLTGGESGVTTLATSARAEAQVYFDVSLPQPTLIIIGAGHISIPLSQLARVLGYHVTVIDARETFATPERLPEANDIIVEWPDEALARIPVTPSTAVAVLTHDDKFDAPALVAALRGGAGYVGAIGSRGTRERRNQRLREAGLSDEQIARIYGPIGLDIGAQTPEEIALAILAQIVATHRRPPLKSTAGGSEAKSKAKSKAKSSIEGKLAPSSA